MQQQDQLDKIKFKKGMTLEEYLMDARHAKLLFQPKPDEDLYQTSLPPYAPFSIKEIDQDNYQQSYEHITKQTPFFLKRNDFSSNVLQASGAAICKNIVQPYSTKQVEKLEYGRKKHSISPLKIDQKDDIQIKQMTQTFFDPNFKYNNSPPKNNFASSTLYNKFILKGIPDKKYERQQLKKKRKQHKSHEKRFTQIRTPIRTQIYIEGIKDKLYTRPKKK